MHTADNVNPVEECPIQNSFIFPQYLEEDELFLNEDVLQLIENFEGKEKVSQESLKYIAGFVAHRFKNKYNLGVPTNQLNTKQIPDWLQFISREQLQ